MAYTDKSQVEAYIGASLPSSLTAQLNLWCVAIKEWIDNYVGFSFESGAAADRYFDGSGDRELLVDKFYGTPTISTLDSDGIVDLTLDTNYIVSYPLNKTQKDRIRLLPGGTIAVWPSLKYSVKINATWGWSASAPEEIKLAATRMLSKVIDNRSGGEMTSESLGDYSISYKDIDEAAEVLGVKDILDQYRPIEL